eukprot:scaffold43125_cov71-Cyclotella_meneghiniana.AAC.2
MAKVGQFSEDLTDVARFGRDVIGVRDTSQVGGSHSSSHRFTSYFGIGNSGHLPSPMEAAANEQVVIQLTFDVALLLSA